MEDRRKNKGGMVERINKMEGMGMEDRRKRNGGMMDRRKRKGGMGMEDRRKRKGRMDIWVLFVSSVFT